ncbi:GTP pyrophosphokinase [Bacillus sp. K2I17]|uniref:GTP pyrophosphokinase n=1 Tax=Bacillus sp. K2I17 TaxID=2014743 RepID=UPI0015C679AB|nr:hypothetical protein [Bacillus sp. K2I17]
MVRNAVKKEANEKVDSAIEWYRKNKDYYERLALKIELIIKEILDCSKISFHSVTSRAKDIESFGKKASKDKYSDPKCEILDLAAIRVTAYVESDVSKICEVLEKEFKIIPEHSSNKSDVLNYNEVGYRSVHYVAKLNDNRAKLPEYKRLDAPFEIQVRTILQHAWAEIEHDRNYKFEGIELPEHAKIKRRFALLAGQLELADREFDSIVKDIDLYSNQVIQDTKQGKLDIPIDSISLSKYLSNKLEPISEYIQKNELMRDSKLIVKEVLNFGIMTLLDLDNLINENELIEKIKIHGEKGHKAKSFNSVLRRLMLIVDAEKYFAKSYTGYWKTRIDGALIDFIEHNGVNKNIFEENNAISKRRSVASKV